MRTFRKACAVTAFAVLGVFTFGVLAPAPSAGAFPDASSTGPTTPVTELTHRTPAWVESNCLSQPDNTVSAVYVDGGNLDLPSGCKLTDFVLDGQGAQYGIRTINGQTGVDAAYGEIFNATSTGVYGGGIVAASLDIHDIGADGAKLRSNSALANSWVHDLGTGPCSPECPHADMVQFDGPVGSTISTVWVVGNNCDMGVGNVNGVLTGPPPGYQSNACIQHNKNVNLVGVFIDQNRLVGGNYTVNCSVGSASTQFRYNTFGIGVPSDYTTQPGDYGSPLAQAADARYGPNTGCPNTTGNVWADGTTPL
jgi:hypothetical protein